MCEVGGLAVWRPGGVKLKAQRPGCVKFAAQRSGGVKFITHLDTQEISETTCYAHNNVLSFEKRGLGRLTFYD
jgi:hypothetical protein